MKWITEKIATFGAVLAGLVLALARYNQVKRQRNKARNKANDLEAQVEAIEDIAEADAEIAAEYSDLKREAIKDVKNGEKMPDNISDRDNY